MLLKKPTAFSFVTPQLMLACCFKTVCETVHYTYSNKHLKYALSILINAYVDILDTDDQYNAKIYYISQFNHNKTTLPQYS